MTMRDYIFSRLKKINGVVEKIEGARHEYSGYSAGEAGKEFVLHWLVRGDSEEGLFAAISDTDDVIEFGLLARLGEGNTRNVLNVSCVLVGDAAEIYCASEAHTEFNFESTISISTNIALLDGAIDLFLGYFI